MVSRGSGWFAGTVLPLGSLKDWLGMKPAVRGISIGVGTPAGIMMGLLTEPPVPQQVDVIKRKKLH